MALSLCLGSPILAIATLLVEREGGRRATSRMAARVMREAVERGATACRDHHRLWDARYGWMPALVRVARYERRGRRAGAHRVGAVRGREEKSGRGSNKNGQLFDRVHDRCS